MSAKCKMCNLLKDGKLLYQDKLVSVFLSPEPSSAGHLVVFPNEHILEIETMDDKDAEHVFHIANKASAAVFETLGAHGTNIILNNGTYDNTQGHFWIDIVPRFQDDGINPLWEPKQIPEDQMEDIVKKIADKTFILNPPKKEEIETVNMDKKEEKVEASEENYLYKQLNRQP